MTSYTQVVAELGVVVYTALDFSLAEEEQRSLSSGLEHLIDMMTSADSEQGNTQDLVDEGIGQEEERGNRENTVCRGTSKDVGRQQKAPNNMQK